MQLDVDGERLAEICDRFGIGVLFVFGSTVRGDGGPDSDVDLLYELRPGARLGWEIEDLAGELADLFGRPVDLVSRRSVHPLIRSAVLAEAEPVHAA